MYGNTIGKGLDEPSSRKWWGLKESPGPGWRGRGVRQVDGKFRYDAYLLARWKLSKGTTLSASTYVWEKDAPSSSCPDSRQVSFSPNNPGAFQAVVISLRSQCVGPLRGTTWDSSSLCFTQPQSLLVFTARRYRNFCSWHWNPPQPRFPPHVKLPHVGLGPPCSMTRFEVFAPSTSLDGFFFNFLVVRLPF